MIPTEKQRVFHYLKVFSINSHSRAWADLVDYIEQPSAEIPTFQSDYSKYADQIHRVYSLFRAPKNWDIFEIRLLAFLKNSFWIQSNTMHSDNDLIWFINQITHENNGKDHKIIDQICIKQLIGNGVSEHLIWIGLHNQWTTDYNNLTPFLSKYALNYVLNNADKYLSTLNYNVYNSEHFIDHLIEGKPELIDKYLHKFINRLAISPSLKKYISINPEKHENDLINCFSDQNYDYDKVFNFMNLMRTNYPNKYAKELELCAQTHFNFIFNDSLEINTSIFNDYLNTLLMYNSVENAFKISHNYLIKFKGSDFDNTKLWLKKLKQYKTAMTPDIIENLWLFARHADKSVRQQTAQHLAKTLGETAIPEAEKMLLEKKPDVRLTGALILSLIKTEKAMAILRGCIEAENNDEVRNAMLEGMSAYMVQNATIEFVAEAVAAAQKRGKLTKPVLPWLANYPTLKYKNSTISLDSATILFLFYRMSQAKDIRTDIEARPLLTLIDRETSAPFAKWLLDAYFQNGADAKFKWCLTLGAMLGGDNEIAFLQRNVVSFADNNRGKMAENVVKALALQGSQRALRAVEFFSRKYKTKNKNVGAAALEAFDVAAEELGMTPYELADSVIPDFGFDGLFKEFEANNEPYRAFIGNDFKLAFLDEDNKQLKALPKGTSAAIKEEFKEIGKEIRDIVKSQSSRLEQYLVIQRRWTADKWQAFFLTNPVMFVYAVRLIWGVFDENNHLIAVFRCQEDQTLTDAEGNDIDFDELKIKNSELKIAENAQNTEGVFDVGFGMSDVGNTSEIGMVHPISLDAETIDFWKNDLLENGIEAIFPQLNRPVIALKDIDKNLKMTDEFEGITVSGYGFLSRMDKTGWTRGSVVDGGGIASYFKEFTEVGLVAIIMQTGSLSVGYYDADAELGKLMFVKKAGVRFGSYMYDKPSVANDPRLVRFGDVPPIVYSEVMADMLFFKENQVK